jgi:hypothetical protein
MRFIARGYARARWFQATALRVGSTSNLLHKLAWYDFNTGRAKLDGARLRQAIRWLLASVDGVRVPLDAHVPNTLLVEIRSRASEIHYTVDLEQVFPRHRALNVETVAWG